MYAVRRIASASPITSSLRQSGVTFRNGLRVRCKSAVTNDKEATKAALNSTTTAKTTTTEATTSFPYAQCLLAAAAGVGTVAAAAAVIETTTADSCPSFDPQGQRFDASTFLGRFSRMLLACDPYLLSYSEDHVRQSQDMVKHWHQWYNGTPEMDRTLWEAKRIVDAAVHPDTNEVIPRPFRMSGYVFYNGPVCVAMLASQSTLPLLGWAWVNQSQNALVNYYNRNASSPMSNETLLKSYAAAVGSALVVAFGLATVIQKRFDAAKAKSLLRWVAFPSAVVASSLNCYIVRSPEIESGIPLTNAEGHNVLEGETSQIAATRGVNSTTLSRAFLQAPVYFLPPLLVSLGPLKAFITKRPTLAVPVTTFMVLASFGVGLPATVAIFPQISEIPAAEVEDKFQHLRHPRTNQPYEVFYYNKGL